MRLIYILILWPKHIGNQLLWAGPLLARIVVGYVFMLTGWGKLQHLDRVTQYFGSLGIPAPEILTPLVSGWEFVGGALLILGLMTRVSAGGLAVIMIVATLAAQADDIASLSDLLGLEEMLYFALFTWLAIFGAGRVSIDAWIERRFAAISCKRSRPPLRIPA